MSLASFVTAHLNMSNSTGFHCKCGSGAYFIYLLFSVLKAFIRKFYLFEPRSQQLKIRHFTDVREQVIEHHAKLQDRTMFIFLPGFTLVSCFIYNYI